jgi:hypothetical protein
MFSKKDKSSPKLNDLSLSGEQLSSLNVDQLKEMFDAIPTSVVNLDLGAGALSSTDAAEALSKVFSTIPQAVVNIKLSGKNEETSDTLLEKMNDLGIDVNEKPQGPK